MSSPVCVFSDGTKWACPFVTKSEYLDLKNSRKPIRPPPAAKRGAKKGGTKEHTAFETKHSVSKERIRVHWVDGESLWSLKLKPESGAEHQICQVKVKDRMTKEAGCAILTRVAKDFAANKVEQKDRGLFKLRDELKNEYEAALPKEVPTKAKKGGEVVANGGVAVIGDEQEGDAEVEEEEENDEEEGGAEGGEEESGEGDEEDEGNDEE